jgi:hypothetical protein
MNDLKPIFISGTIKSLFFIEIIIILHHLRLLHNEDFLRFFIVFFFFSLKFQSFQMILIVLISLGFADIYTFWIQNGGVLSHKVAFQIFLFLLLLYLIIGCVDLLLFLFNYHVKLRLFLLRHFTHQEFIYHFLNVFVVLKVNSFNRLAVMGASQHLKNLLDVVFVLRGGYLRRALGIALCR